MCVNKVMLMGRLTKTPEIKTAKTGKNYTSFTLAIDSKKKDAPAIFVNCNAFEKRAETICKYFGKGNMIFVEGYVSVYEYTEKKTGTKCKMMCVDVLDFSFCGEKKNEQKADNEDEDFDDFLS